MFKIAIIKPNDALSEFGAQPSEHSAQFNDLISDLVTFEEVTAETFMDKIVTTINLKPDGIGDTSLSYEDHDSIYQLCHLPENKKNGVKGDVNGLASVLTMGRIEIYGHAVLFKSKIKDDYTCETASITADDIKNILTRKFFHKAVRITTDNLIEEVRFTNDPFEGMDMADYKYVELPLFKFNLVLYMEKSPSSGVNRFATKLMGKHRILGDVLIVSHLQENEYIDIDKELILKLLKVSGGTLSSRELTDLEKKAGEKKEGLPMIINRYNLLEKRLREYENRCSYCKEELELNKTCTGCYREIYHSIDCQRGHWDEHKLDCTHNCKPANFI